MKAILFDIYETLIMAKPITAEQRNHNLELLKDTYSLEPELDLINLFKSRIEALHAASPFPHPEVDVREVWNEALPNLTDPSQFAADYEEAVHPTQPVPNAGGILLKLHLADIPLGIVSNAQAYTHALLERHLNDASSYFDPEISVFSYVHRRAKPDTFLFEAAIAPLNNRGIPNEAILMIGDSPSNDMAPAKQRGLRTHLIEPGNLSLPQEW